MPVNIKKVYKYYKKEKEIFNLGSYPEKEVYIRKIGTSDNPKHKLLNIDEEYIISSNQSVH